MGVEENHCFLFEFAFSPHMSGRCVFAVGWDWSDPDTMAVSRSVMIASRFAYIRSEEKILKKNYTHTNMIALDIWWEWPIVYPHRFRSAIDQRSKFGSRLRRRQKGSTIVHSGNRLQLNFSLDHCSFAVVLNMDGFRTEWKNISKAKIHHNFFSLWFAVTKRTIIKFDIIRNYDEWA